MAEFDFYNQNKGRLYPFVPTPDAKLHFTLGVDLPNEAILDANFVVGPLAEFVTDQHDVRLKTMLRAGNAITFVFETTAPSSSGHFFTFTRDKNDTFATTDFTEADTPDFGVGFLVTGSLLVLHAALPEGIEVIPFTPTVEEDSVIEPALILSRNKHSVQTLNVGNLPKPSAISCCDTLPVPDLSTVVVETEGIIGEVALKEGVNVNISVAPDKPVITFRPEIGAGAGVPCGDINEVPTAQPKCGDIIYSINGITPSPAGSFLLSAGNGFIIDTFPLLNKIIIKGVIETSVACETI